MLPRYIIRKTQKKYNSKYTKKKETQIAITKNKISKKQEKIKVLTYNISWESMTGAKDTWMLCSNKDDPEHPRHHSKCVGNIGDVIEENPVDFICLQEAANFKSLIKHSLNLAKMSYYQHNSGLDDMVTFWDSKKYKLVKTKKGEFEEGRPYLATYFKSGLCVINVHFGHYTDAGEIKHLARMISELKLKDYIEEGNRVIIAGDFNNNIKNLAVDVAGGIGNGKKLCLDLEDVKFWVNSRHLLTCCLKRRKHNDHVIDSLAEPSKVFIPDVHFMASDHKPVIAELVA